ncbi:MAG: quinohemoprotein amine dehydrogenase subunit alpha [Terriglobia bacterium]|nr:MAG: quinohemoprotein amine dehydrogenase subunit alpha [Terriglobia bacterium]
MKLPGTCLLICALCGVISGQSNDAGIPVTDRLVIDKCGTCHPRDESGNMQRVSWQRTTPEGWQDEIKQMILRNGLSLTPEEARSIVRSLSADHGLSPEEARPVMYDPERRITEETNIPSERMRECGRCHAFARALEWRRSAAEWKEFSARHTERYKIRAGDEAVAFLTTAAPLHTPQWEAWSTRKVSPDLSGTWLVNAYVPGRGSLYGRIQIDRSAAGEYNTRVELRSVKDGLRIVRAGRGAVFGGYAWRGRSSSDTAVSPPDSLASEAREVMWFAPDQSSAEGRWFWGQYQEFEFNVKIQRRPSGSTLLALDCSALRLGSRSNRISVFGDRLPDKVSAADFDLGTGVTVRSIVSHTPDEAVLDVDVAQSAQPGKRDFHLGASVLHGAIAIYDRIDYVDVRPGSSVAAFGDREHPKGFHQFEAIAYQRGPDGRLHTPDDLELGPVDADWSVQVFHAAEGASSQFVGTMSASGLFTPADKNPGNNFDCWVTAVTKERDRNGEALTGKSYMVVTVPTYVFNGRRYVRDLDRWIDDGPAGGAP